MGRMCQQLIKSANKSNAFKLVSLTENRKLNRKILGIRPELNSKNAFKNANRFLIDLTEVTFTDYEGCDIDTSSIKFNSFELIALESSFNITIEGLHPS